MILTVTESDRAQKLMQELAEIASNHRKDIGVSKADVLCEWSMTADYGFAQITVSSKYNKKGGK